MKQPFTYKGKPPFAIFECAGVLAGLDPHLPGHQHYVSLLQPFSQELPTPDCPCTTWDDDRHIFTLARPGWVRYTNARFGFSVEVPADWFRTCPPLNGDGQRFVSPDGMIQLTFYGFMNNEKETLDEYVRKWMEAKGALWSGYREVDSARAFMVIRYPTCEGRVPCAQECFLEKHILLLGPDKGQGILLRVATPRFSEALLLLEKVLHSYRANLTGRRSPH